MRLLEKILNRRVSQDHSNVGEVDIEDGNQRLSQAKALEDRLARLPGVIIPPDKTLESAASDVSHLQRIHRNGS